MPVQRFTVILAGVGEMTDELANALYEAGCDDGSPGSCAGVARVDFDREADSLDDAIRSALTDVRRAGVRVERVEISGEDLQALADTATAHPPART